MIWTLRRAYIDFRSAKDTPWAIRASSIRSSNARIMKCLALRSKEARRSSIMKRSRPDRIAGRAGAGWSLREKHPVVTIGREREFGADIISLLHASNCLMADLYPAESNHLLDFDALKNSAVSFYVARLDGVPVGCGAWVRRSCARSRAQAHIRDSAARGQKIGRSLLEAIETDARLAGVTTINLKRVYASRKRSGCTGPTDMSNVDRSHPTRLTH